MPKWTKEQMQAITLKGENIIVSAGAGSGKTAVLSERVLTKLREGIKINELLILTFTNAAAKEMKDRIRKKIRKEADLQENLDYLESAYITTFDSYTLSLVKKYNYLLNVSSNLSIIDGGVVRVLKEKFMDNVFLELYNEENPLFIKFLDTLTIKSDDNIKEVILNIADSMSSISNLQEYLDNFIENYLSQEKINEYLNEYIALIKRDISIIEDNLLFIESSEFNDYYLKLMEALSPLIKAKTYDEFKKYINVSMPRRPRDSEEVKIYKDNIDATLKNIKKYLRFTSEEEVINTLESTKEYVQIIILIIKRYYQKLWDYKFKNDLYEFNDISLMAIRLLKENKDVCEEVKNSFQEICIDEYQDTNDLQEEFVNIIGNNNVYMVGDIKQSIYGFRNANPLIFKNKYDLYAKNKGGIKIDLLKNFRSREEVIKPINEIFNLIMDNDLGGINYKRDHQMIFGNVAYLECKMSDYNLSLYNYENTTDFKNSEIEAYFIARDILNKIKNKFMVIDKDTSKYREVKFSDFCIIMDRGSDFPLYKKIFEYLQVPLSIYEDKILTSEVDIKLLNNILGFILRIKNSIFDERFTYYFLSIARSFLSDLDDNEIFNIIKNKSIKETTIFLKALEISKRMDTLSNYDILKTILDEFNFYERLIKIGNIEDVILRVDNLLNIAKSLSDMGYTPSDFYEYIEGIILSKNEIKYQMEVDNKDSVKIMNIHKSKGLEFSICYFSGLFKTFNTSDIKDRFIYSKTYGIITPYFKDGIDSTILKDLLKDKYLLEDVEEKIRLFYVALTRCREKIIIVCPKSEEVSVSSIVPFNIRRKYNSFLSIMASISSKMHPYIKNIDTNSLNLSKDYLYDNKSILNINNIDKHEITYKDLNILEVDNISKVASKGINKLITNIDSKKLQIGSEIHKIMEMTDFLNIPKDNPYRNEIMYLKDYLKIDNNTLIYKEKEFIYEDNNVTYHGIMDLVLVNEDVVKVVDYKLKNILDKEYIKQLSIYYNYLKTIFNKEIKLYLYSILDKDIKEIEPVGTS